MPPPVDVYISFAPEDAASCETLERHLARFVNKGRIRVAHQGKVAPGQNINAVLDVWFSQARIVVLLRTVNFENNDRCRSEEQCAFERQERHEARAVPVLVRHHALNTTRVFPAGVATLPGRGFVESWPNRDEAWTVVAEGIYGIVKSLLTAEGYVDPPVSMPMHAPLGQHYQTPGVSPMQPQYAPQQAAPQAATTANSEWGAMFRKAVGLCLLGYAVYLAWPSTAHENATAAPPAPVAPIQVATTPLAPRTTTTPTGIYASSCCGGIDCQADAENRRKLPDVCLDGQAMCGKCGSGRARVPGACSENLSAEQRYSLRLAHALINGNEPSKDALVCFRRPGATESRTCVPYSSAHANSEKLFATPPLPVPIVLGELIHGKGIQIEIWEPGQLLPSLQFTASHNYIKTTALCIGLRLAPPNAKDTRVLVFIDDP
ncbi:TIR domain-containing protein [Polyangium mundeleinium]|uniref:TIR domain-containing protein n=1 Tax=Polyangium mundeleinium TaxID=2995306 RepID=A0ABT5EGH7_9BACT|nr:TIR domain-containing protein [Polyangium mundeleinium]MDC0740929.1 TIR domain-containing protein [Polyangium mundeleinium]